MNMKHDPDNFCERDYELEPLHVVDRTPLPPAEWETKWYAPIINALACLGFLGFVAGAAWFLGAKTVLIIGGLLWLIVQGFIT